MRLIRLLTAAAAALALLGGGRAVAAALEEAVGPAQLTQVTGAEPPAVTYITSDPSDPGRLFLAERDGVVVEVDNGQAAIFADLRDFVSCCSGERGLASVAPAPDFATSGRIYAAFTGTPAAGGEEGDIHLEALSHGPEGELLREPILTIPHSESPIHSSGQLQFGPDGLLYMTVGDGGEGAPSDNAQNLDVLLGKLLRIEPQPGASPSYESPPDNPFVGGEGRDEIWAYGLRNAWRFSFDRLTGDLIVADVGEGGREEIDFAPAPALGAGANYGWDCREGTLIITAEPSPECASASGFTDPVFEYPHGEPTEPGGAHGCAIVGGYVVRDPGVPALDGRYLYGDLCTGEIRSIDLSAAEPSATDRSEQIALPRASIYSFGEDAANRVYLTTGSGAVFRLVEGPPTSSSEPGPEEAARPPAGRRKRGAARIALRVLRRDGQVVAIRARVVPCAGNRGRRLVLRKDGRGYRAKRLNGRCVARFRVRPKTGSSFRALLPLGKNAGIVRSRRLVLRPREG